MGKNKKTLLATNGEELVNTIRALGSELKISPSSLEHLDLDTSFDNELGLDSLTRVEFIARIEKHFQINLAESTFANAATPRELLREILSAQPEKHSASKQEISALKLEQTSSTPRHAQTLSDILDWHLQVHPDRPHIQFHTDSGSGETIRYRQLKDRSDVLAAGLQARGFQPGQAAAIMLPSCPDYFYTFFGILTAGGIPVPIYPPARLNQIEDHLIRHKSILNSCSTVVLVTIAEALPVARLLKTHVESLHTVVTPSELTSNTTPPVRPKQSSLDIAFLQYTSGSTGIPKGVTLSHANLLANIRAMGTKLEVNSSDVFVSWLPLYHDMGLIGAWFGSLYFSALLVILSPLDFLAKPERWLWAIHRYRATLTAAPNFAYELCLKRTTMEQFGGLRLDSVRAMFNGAEPVSPGTMQRFSDRFSGAGLKPTALMPVYGLAECTVGLTFPPLNRGPLVDRVSRDHFMKKGFAERDPDSTDALQFVACGLPIQDHEIRIIDASGRELPDRHQGQLQFRGPSATCGYYNNPEKTRDLFDNDWLNSGDLAYIANGEVYLTGRAKDLIIHAGRNIYPQELEEKISELPNIRKGCVAVFGSANHESGTEKLIVLAETREIRKDKRQEIKTEINRVITHLIGTTPDEIILASPQTVLKTSSGKLRRSGCKALYENNQLGKGSRPVWLQFCSLILSGIAPELKHLRQATFSVIYAAYCWLVFGILAALTWLTVVLCPPLSLRFKIIRYAIRIWSWLIRVKITVRGTENLSDMNQPCILACNHCSYLDSPVLMLALPIQFSFVAKAELKGQFVARTFLDRIQTEYVTRFTTEKGVADFKKITRAARSGKNLLFFPEGTFTRIPGLRPFYMGTFKTAAETGHTLIPIVINGTRSILRPDSWFPRHGAIRVDILSPIIRNHNDSTGDQWNTAMKLRDRTRKKILFQLREPDLSN